MNGQQLGRDGRWQGRHTNETVAPGRNGYLVTVPPTSAALVTVRPRRSARR
jgi:hypothetical protein